MTEKRFFIDTVDGGGSVLSDDGVPLLLYEVCGLLNELHEENQQLKQELKNGICPLCGARVSKCGGLK